MRRYCIKEFRHPIVMRKSTKYANRVAKLRKLAWSARVCFIEIFIDAFHSSRARPDIHRCYSIIGISIISCCLSVIRLINRSIVIRHQWTVSKCIGATRIFSLCGPLCEIMSKLTFLSETHEKAFRTKLIFVSCHFSNARADTNKDNAG